METPLSTQVPEYVSDVSMVRVGVTTRAAMTSAYEPASSPEIVRIAPEIVVGKPLGVSGSAYGRAAWLSVRSVQVPPSDAPGGATELAPPQATAAASSAQATGETLNGPPS